MGPGEPGWGAGSPLLTECHQVPGNMPAQQSLLPLTPFVSAFHKNNIQGKQDLRTGSAEVLEQLRVVEMAACPQFLYSFIQKHLLSKYYILAGLGAQKKER